MPNREQELIKKLRPLYKREEVLEQKEETLRAPLRKAQASQDEREIARLERRMNNIYDERAQIGVTVTDALEKHRKAYGSKAVGRVINGAFGGTFVERLERKKQERNNREAHELG
jgi:hypothetical protein